MVSLKITFAQVAVATGPNRLLPIWVLLVVLVAVFSSAVSAAAAEVSPNGKVVQISRVSAYPLDSDVLVSVSLKAGKKLSDARLIISVPELGVTARQRVDFSKNKEQAVHIEVPVPVGFDPYLRIAFNSGEGRRVKHLPVILQ